MAARRVSLPAADELFRPTRQGDKRAGKAGASEKPAAKRSSGRVRHDEKMTVYVTSDELLELEHARLSLRSKHGLAVDRGRLVREAVAIVLADLESNGEQSALVRRLADG
jgi:hypothetical protein